MVNLKKTLFILLSVLFLNGCLQSTAMLGPAITLGSTGNIMHAGLQFGANKAIKKETGKDTLTYIADAVDQGINDKKAKKELANLLENHIKKSRKLINIKN